MTSFSKSHVSRQVSWYFHYHSMRESNTTENIECSVMCSEKISKMVVDFLETCVLYDIPACFIYSITWYSDPGTNSNTYYIPSVSAPLLISLLTFLPSTLASIPSLSWILRVVLTRLAGCCVTSWCSYFL